ncbi:oligosaccharide flippase family protein [Halorubellus litoreus]|uniref:Oligosaccharide flippase family protein n=1 Tax=Halorubellus litoreus TaxID=755308 RepID=A0ABD5VBL2_9EURY
MAVGVETSKRFLTNVLGTVAGFLGTLYFTRELGFAGVGTYAVFVSLQMVAGSLATFGVFAVLTKRVSEGRDQAAYFTTGALLVGAGTAAVAAVTVALRGPINAVVGVDVALLVPAGVLSWGLFRLSGAFLEGKQRVALAGALDSGRHAVVVPIQVALVLDGYGVHGLVYGLVAGQTLTFLASYLGYARVVPNLPTLDVVRDFLGYSKYAYVQVVADQLFKHADYVILGTFAGAGPTGVYKNAFQITEASTLFASALSKVSFPKLSELTETGDDAEVARLFAALFTYGGLVAIPVAAGGAVVGNDLLLTLYGENPGTTTLPLLGVVGLANALVPLLAVANLLNGYRTSLERFSLGTGNPRLYAASGVVLVTVYAVTAVPLTIAYDAWGVAIATVLAFGVSVAANLVLLDERVPLGALRDVGAELLAALVMTGVVAVLVDALGAAHGALRLGFVLAIGATTYFAVLLALSERIRIDARHVADDILADVR